MSSKPQRDSKPDPASSERKPLPFEPKKSRKQLEKEAEALIRQPTVAASKPVKAGSTGRKPANGGIPDAVSRRMVKRMAVFSGIPTAIGMSTFFISYWIVSHDILEIPTYVVLLLSLGGFGLGVLGLSYGALSASWEEDQAGSLLGWTEFATNWGRMTEGWKAARQEAREAASKKP